MSEFTEAKKTTLDLKVEQKYGNILKKFRILHCNWEMDSIGYVVNNGSKHILVTTNHGRLTELSSNYLKHKIKEYSDAIEETKEAIHTIENGTY